jgi:hypothetical protein
MFTKLFESNCHAMGSFANGKATVTGANASLMMHFTRRGFDGVFTGSGATTGGFLSRCTLIHDTPQLVRGVWRDVNRPLVHEVAQALLTIADRRKTITETPGAAALRLEVLEGLNHVEPIYSARLRFLFAQDLYARAMFSLDGVDNPEGGIVGSTITEPIVRAAAEWTHRQLSARQMIWPIDHSPDKFERMHLALTDAFKKHRKLTDRELRKMVHVDRAGSGGLYVYNMAMENLRRAGDITIVGRTRKHRPVWEWQDE